LVNSSFVLRDGVKTTQSPHRLALKFRSPGHLELVGVCYQERMKSPFRRVAHRSRNVPAATPLADAMTEELKGMGDVLFTLIGDVDDHAQAAIELKGVPRY